MASARSSISPTLTSQLPPERTKENFSAPARKVTDLTFAGCSDITNPSSLPAPAHDLKTATETARPTAQKSRSRVKIRFIAKIDFTPAAASGKSFLEARENRVCGEGRFSRLNRGSPGPIIFTVP